MKSSPKCMLLGAILFAFAAGTASAAVILESEPNDTLATAQEITDVAASLQIQGSRTFDDPSDDFFSFNVLTTGVLRISSSSPNDFADSILGLFGPGGTLLASNDDVAPGNSMSGLEYIITMPGIYTIGFSGFNPGLLACTDTVTECYDTDGDFVLDTFVAGGGSGGSTEWDYTITITGLLVPEPGSLALLALALPAVVALDLRRARRNRRSTNAS